MTMKAGEWLRQVDDESLRCWWAGDDTQYQAYHDTEWGRPVCDDRALFEKVCLEGFQSGLSWLTILRKRENFRKAFHGFDIYRVSHFDESDIARLLADAGIVRHRGKIEAVINNAQRATELIGEVGSLRDFFWSYAVKFPTQEEVRQSSHPSGIPTTSVGATQLSKDLKKRGWKFVGPTTMYSFMQSMGLVNDHLVGCFLREECEELRLAVLSQQ